MSIITPLIDTLLHQVLGRRADIERVSASKPDSPLTAVLRIGESRDATAQAGQHRGAAPLAQGGRDGLVSAKAAQVAGQYRQEQTSSNPQGAKQASGASTQLHLSNDAKTIASVINRFSTLPAVSSSGSPLMSGERIPVAPVLAGVLHRQLASSGVFYESHLLEWYSGTRTLQQLLDEPQARLSMVEQLPKEAPSAEARHALGRGEAAASSLLALDDASAELPTARSASHHTHETILPLLRQQLEVLGTQSFRWEGIAWPGVPMQWEIRDEGDGDERRQNEDVADERPWNSYLKLTLPVLGELDIRLSLKSKTLALDIASSSALQRDRLAAEATALRERIEAAGFEALALHFKTRAPSADE